MSEALSKLKYSRFRHVYSKSVRRSEWYDTGPGHGLAVAANPKMIALAIDVPAGGVVQIAKLCRMGRGRMELGKIKDHEGAVCDVKWNPFNDNVLATGSHDTTVRIWHIDDMLRIRSLRISRAHSRRVHTIEWHTTVDNAVFSASLDGQIVLWNIETDNIVYKIEDCNAVSINLSYNCSEFAVTTKSRELSIHDARTGEKQRSTQLVHDGTMLSRVLFYGIPKTNNSERLITTGSSRSTRRQVAIYNSMSLNAPLAVVDIDGGSGFLMPIVDNDLNLLYIAGKGDANIRFYELLKDAPFISYLNESSGSKAHTAVCMLPKRGLNVLQCEIMRIFRVDAEQLVIEPLSFFVPRRADGFQADLYPATRSPTPSLSFREWLAGLNREPIMLELKDCLLNCTNKPVTFAKESNRTKLMIADVNNDRKFRFLSQVTKPDYREITDREDREELLKIEMIKAKLAAESADEISKEQHIDEKMDETNGIHIGEENNGNGNTPASPSSPVSEKNAPIAVADTDVIALNEKNSSANPRIANIIDRSASLFSIKSDNGVAAKTDSALSVSLEGRSISRCDGLLMLKSQMVRKLSNGNDKLERGRSENNDSNRSCLSEEAIVNVLREMERELWKCRSRCEQLEKIVHLQQQDIESLRYEIHWKDSRIDFLQSQLQQLDMTRDTSRSS
uniref:Coronin n=1 Tax=Elaeophora elaphi TaxID=1147741 RepID=A0A158Q8T5_9BILA